MAEGLFHGEVHQALDRHTPAADTAGGLLELGVEGDQVHGLGIDPEPVGHLGGRVEVVSEVVRIPELANLFRGPPLPRSALCSTRSPRIQPALQ